MKFKNLSYLLFGVFTISPLYAGEPVSLERNAIGGWKAVTAEAKQFFYTKEINGVWWYIDPAGNGFISKGVNHISYTADFSPALGYSPYAKATEQKYGTESAWAKAAAKNLRQWGFNTVGAWSGSSMYHQELAFTTILNLSEKAGGNWLKGIFPDVYSDAFRRGVRQAAHSQCSKYKDDTYLLGYFTDNELHWGPDWRSKNALLIDFLKLSPETAGGSEARRFLTARYPKVADLNAAWNIQVDSLDKITALTSLPNSDSRSRDESDFLKQTAGEYFRISREAILAEDPNHLVLGCRFAGKPPEVVLEAIKDYVDVISFHSYNFAPPISTLNRVHEITGRPMMLTEFSFKAKDSGLPNTKGAGSPVEDQKSRADYFTSFTTSLLELPYMIGYHWFEYADEPAEGRFDGENSNYGLVNIKDEPWEILTQQMTRVQAINEKIHIGKANVSGIDK